MPAVLIILGLTASVSGGQPAPTFSKDIAPILNKHCQSCHRPGGAAPMSLLSFEDARPWAVAMKRETSLRRMPPWHIEKGIGVQRYREDPSLTDAEIATIAAWADGGAQPGEGAEPASRPSTDPPEGRRWSIGAPDLVVLSPQVVVEAMSPDWWGAIGDTPTGLAEDRYIAAVETMELSDAGTSAVFHHAGLQTLTPDGQLDFGTIHEVGRGAEWFDPDASPMLRAGSAISFNNAHVHASGSKTTARLAVALKFHPRGFTPKYARRGITIGTADLDVRGNEGNQLVEAFVTLQQPARLLNFEPHMHASGSRMCLEAVWGAVRQTLTCMGFDPRWVRNYAYDTDSAPLLPRGTILRLIGWLDTRPNPKNPYLVDPRNWTGWGSRPVDNMFMNYLSVALLTNDQMKAEVAKRLDLATQGKGELVGCLPCTLPYALDPAAQ